MNDSPTYQLLARASGFFEAARIVVNDSGNKSSLRAPVAHLISHGLEVLMKHVLLVEGKTEKEIKSFGHDLCGMWNANEMVAFRKIATEEAALAWDRAKTSGEYEDEFMGDPVELLDEYIAEYSRLHSGDTNYALRYHSSDGETVPIPLFFLDTFQPTKDELARAYSRRAIE